MDFYKQKLNLNPHGSQIQCLHIGYINLVKCGALSMQFQFMSVSQTLMVLSTEAEYSLTNLDGTIY